MTCCVILPLSKKKKLQNCPANNSIFPPTHLHYFKTSHMCFCDVEQHTKREQLNGVACLKPFYVWSFLRTSPPLLTSPKYKFKMTWLFLIFQECENPGSALGSGCFSSSVRQIAWMCVLALPPLKLRWKMSGDSRLPVITSNIFFPHAQSLTSTNDCKLD